MGYRPQPYTLRPRRDLVRVHCMTQVRCREGVTRALRFPADPGASGQSLSAQRAGERASEASRSKLVSRVSGC